RGVFLSADRLLDERRSDPCWQAWRLRPRGELPVRREPRHADPHDDVAVRDEVFDLEQVRLPEAGHPGEKDQNWADAGNRRCTRLGMAPQGVQEAEDGRDAERRLECNRQVWIADHRCQRARKPRRIPQLGEHASGARNLRREVDADGTKNRDHPRPDAEWTLGLREKSLEPSAHPSAGCEHFASHPLRERISRGRPLCRAPTRSMRMQESRDRQRNTLCMDRRAPASTWGRRPTAPAPTQMIAPCHPESRAAPHATSRRANFSYMFAN